MSLLPNLEERASPSSPHFFLFFFALCYFLVFLTPTRKHTRKPLNLWLGECIYISKQNSRVARDTYHHITAHLLYLRRSGQQHR